MGDYSKLTLAELRAIVLAHVGPDVAADAALTLHDHDGRIVWADADAQRILGLSLDQMQGRSSADPRWALIDAGGLFVPLEQRPVLSALRTGRPRLDWVAGVHRPTVDATAEHVWITGSSYPVFDPACESPTWVVTSFTKLDGLEGEVLRLTESERRFRWIAQNANDMVAVMAPDTTHLWVSPSCLALAGHTPDEMVGRTLWDFLHPEDVPAARDVIAAMREGNGESLQLTCRFRHASGRFLWVESVGQAAPPTGDEHLLIRLATRDVTARVVAEIERDVALAELKLVVDHAPIGMCVVDAANQVVQANQALYRLVGYTAEELAEVGFGVLIHPDDAVPSAEDLMLVSGEITSSVSDKRYLRADGETLWVRRTATRVSGSPGRPALFIVQVLDLTDNRAQTRLAAMATTDSLTGLPNRAVLDDRLSHGLTVARRAKTQVGVIFCDVDRFKEVNDTLGHAAGDELLQQVANRISSTIRESDTAVRIGGDEFVVLCENVLGRRPVRLLANRLQKALNRPFVLSSGVRHVSVSMGIAVGDGPSAASLLQEADEAMYTDKRNPRSGFDLEDASSHR